jgi:sugar lactone lactonase YvrE
MNVDLVGLGRMGGGMFRPAADRRLGAESVRRRSAGAPSGEPTQSDRAAHRKRGRRATTLVLGLLATVLLPCAASFAAPESGCHQHFGAAIQSLFELDVVANGITRTADGRTFAPVQPILAPTPRLAEIVGRGGVRPFPDEAWNSYKPGADASAKFVTVVSVRIGPDGAIWVVDKGSLGFEGSIVPAGPKLVRIDPRTNAVARAYHLDSVSAGESFIDDVRFDGDTAYLTDAGRPGLIVLDLVTGAARRVLDRSPSTTGRVPLRAEGRLLRSPAGKPLFFNADQLELSPDGRLLYFQPTSGPMSVVETRLLRNPAASGTLANAVRPFAPTPTTGGTAIDAAGAIYFSDTNKCMIRRITPAGRIETVLADSRLVWVDAMWIDEDGRLLMPASQLNRTPPLNGGRDATRPPFTIFAADLHLKPVRR